MSLWSEHLGVPYCSDNSVCSFDLRPLVMVFCRALVAPTGTTYGLFYLFPAIISISLLERLIISCILYIYYLLFLPVGFTLNTRFLKVLVCYELPL